MRKADYQALASAIRAALDYAQIAEKRNEAPGAEYWRGRKDQASDTAVLFARAASVNRAEFLKA